MNKVKFSQINSFFTITLVIFFGVTVILLCFFDFLFLLPLDLAIFLLILFLLLCRNFLVLLVLLLKSLFSFSWSLTPHLTNDLSQLGYFGVWMLALDIRVNLLSEEEKGRKWFLRWSRLYNIKTYFSIDFFFAHIIFDFQYKGFSFQKIIPFKHIYGGKKYPIIWLAYNLIDGFHSHLFLTYSPSPFIISSYFLSSLCPIHHNLAYFHPPSSKSSHCFLNIPNILKLGPFVELGH